MLCEIIYEQLHFYAQKWNSGQNVDRFEVRYVVVSQKRVTLIVSPLFHKTKTPTRNEYCCHESAFLLAGRFMLLDASIRQKRPLFKQRHAAPAGSNTEHRWSQLPCKMRFHSISRPKTLGIFVMPLDKLKILQKKKTSTGKFDNFAYHKIYDKSKQKSSMIPPRLCKKYQLLVKFTIPSKNSLSVYRMPIPPSYNFTTFFRHSGGYSSGGQSNLKF